MFIIHNPNTYKNVFLWKNLCFYINFGQKNVQKICYRTCILTIYYIFTFFLWKKFAQKKKYFQFCTSFSKKNCLCVIKRVRKT